MTPEILDPTITRFMILSEPRSGTMMLTDALDQNPYVRMMNLYAVNIQRPETFWIQWEELQQQLARKMTHIGITMHRVGEGWIARMRHPRPDRFWHGLRDRNEKIICLYRRNKLRQYLSRKVGIALGSYHVERPRAVQPGKITVDLAELQDHIDDLAELRDRIDPIFRYRMEIAYEDLASDWGTVFRAAEVYLGIPPTGQQPVTVRQETRPLQEALANYDAVKEWCIQNNHGDWLDADNL